MKKGDKVKLVGNFPKEVYGTIVRKGHKNYWVVNIDGVNTEFNEKRLEVVEEK